MRFFFFFFKESCNPVVNKNNHNINQKIKSIYLIVLRNKQQLELYIEQQVGSKLGKEYFKAVCCHPAYLTYMKNAL